MSKNNTRFRTGRTGWVWNERTVGMLNQMFFVIYHAVVSFTLLNISIRQAEALVTVTIEIFDNVFGTKKKNFLNLAMMHGAMETATGCYLHEGELGFEIIHNSL